MAAGRDRTLQVIAGRIAAVDTTHPVRVAIDGVDCAGKTTLADALVRPLEAMGRAVIRAGIDGFHLPRRMRYRRGPESPAGYYHDSFDIERLRSALLEPLGPGGSGLYRSRVFDFRADRNVPSDARRADRRGVLLFDGVFLLRPELESFWDFSVFVEVTFDTVLARAVNRDARLFGDPDAVRVRYERRYVPGQRLYLAECRPHERADVLLDNNDPSNPVIVRL